MYKSISSSLFALTQNDSTML